MKKVALIVLLSFVVCISIFAQTQNSILSKIKNSDFSHLWLNNSTENEGGALGYMSLEPIGFKGDNYQRFYIHYNSVSKSKINPLEYNVTGKTKIKDIISDFSGKIVIKKASIINVNKEDYHTSKMIKLQCEIRYFENKLLTNSGSFSGEMISYFYFDDKNLIQLASLKLGDSESYNETKTTWKSYKNGISKKCNWGVYRIPDSGDLDNGAGEFYVNEKYKHNGWLSYFDMKNSINQESTKYKEDLKKETQKWWE